MRASAALQRTWQLWLKHRGHRVAAALSFYAIFSIAPLIVIFVLTAQALGRVHALADLDSQFGLLLGQSGARGIDALVRASQQNVSRMPLFIGLILVLVAVFAIFMQLQEALDDLWEIPEHKRGGFWEIVALRLHVLIVIFALAAFSVLALIVADVRGRLAGAAANVAVLLVFLTVTYRVLPRTHVSWRAAAIGALITGTIMLLGEAAISTYFSKFHPESAYGSAGSIVVVMLWIYYSAQLFLFGAMLTRALER